MIGEIGHNILEQKKKHNFLFHLNYGRNRKVKTPPLPVKQILVDNFDNIDKILNFDNMEDCFYYLKILKRNKDNKIPPKERLNNSKYCDFAIFLNTYKIKEQNDIILLKDKIIQICEQDNARAYISLNKYKQSLIDKENTTLTETFLLQLNRGKTIFFADSNNVISLIDIDCFENTETKEGTNIWNDIKEILQKHNITPLFEYNTPSGGLHIILPPNPSEEFLKEYQEYDEKLTKDLNISCHITSQCLILYSNVKTKGY